MEIKKLKSTIDEINEELCDLVRKDYLNRIWYFLRDIKYFELLFYLDPQIIGIEEYTTEEDYQNFETYISIYEFEDSVGTYVGRFDKSGYHDINNNLIEIDIALKKDIVEYRGVKQEIFYRPAIGIRFDNLDNYLEVELTEESAFYKINQALLLLWDELVRSGNIDDIKSEYKNIQNLQHKIDNDLFSGYIKIYSRYIINGVPFFVPILGFDCDQCDELLFRNKEYKVLSIVEETKSLLYKDEDEIKTLINESYTISKIYQLDLDVSSMSNSDLIKIATKIENVYTKFYLRNYDSILMIAKYIEARTEDKKIKETVKKLKHVGIIQQFNGLTSIIFLVQNLLVPFFVMKDEDEEIISSIVTTYPSLEAAKAARDYAGHEFYKLPKITLQIGILCSFEFLKILPTLESLIKKYSKT
jgi:hypothetical protein